MKDLSFFGSQQYLEGIKVSRSHILDINRLIDARLLTRSCKTSRSCMDLEHKLTTPVVIKNLVLC